jgi:hypothetical protein
MKKLYIHIWSFEDKDFIHEHDIAYDTDQAIDDYYHQLGILGDYVKTLVIHLNSDKVESINIEAYLQNKIDEQALEIETGV